MDVRKIGKISKNAEKHSRKGALGKKVKPIEQYFTLKLKPVVTKKTELEKMKNNEKNVVVLYEPNNSKEKINFFKKMTSAEEQGPPLMDLNKVGKLGKYTLKRKYPLGKA